jgi:hypothetical protein
MKVLRNYWYGLVVITVLYGLVCIAVQGMQ